MNKQILKLSKVDDKLIAKTLDLTPRESDMMSQYLKIRNKFFELQKAEEDGDENTPGIRSELLSEYENFIQVFGQLNKSRNKNLLLQDVYGFLICASIEVKINQEFKAADILYKSAKGVIEVYKTENVIEALSHVLELYGRVDLEKISEICDKDVEECIREAGDLIYYDPIENMWVTCDRWLSGNVYSKMIKTKEIINKIYEDPVEEIEEAPEIPMGKYTQPRPWKNGR